MLQESLSQLKLGAEPASPAAISASPVCDVVNNECLDTDLALALRISEQEQREIERELQQEQEMMEQVLRLSLQEK